MKSRWRCGSLERRGRWRTLCSRGAFAFRSRRTSSVWPSRAAMYSSKPGSHTSDMYGRTVEWVVIVMPKSRRPNRVSQTQIFEYLLHARAQVLGVDQLRTKEVKNTHALVLRHVQSIRQIAGLRKCTGASAVMLQWARVAPAFAVAALKAAEPCATAKPALPPPPCDAPQPPPWRRLQLHPPVLLATYLGIAAAMKAHREAGRRGGGQAGSEAALVV